MSKTNRDALWVTVVAVFSLLLLQSPVFAAPQAADGPNLLVNGGMEGQYEMQCSLRGGAPWVEIPCGKPIDFATTFLWATAQVPAGWTAWWQPPNENSNDPNFYNNFPNLCYKGTAPAGCAAWHNPEFRDTLGGPQTPPSRKVAGDNSQKYFTFYSLHEAGLYQTVGGLGPGQRVRFNVYMEAWSTATNDPFTSEGQPTMGLKVGIDPFGGNNPWSSNIVWSPIKEAFDHWELFTVEAVAQSDRVTVFTRSRPFFAIQHNDVYVDEASLVVVGTSIQTTRTPRPTVRGTPKATATLRVTRTPRASATPTSEGFAIGAFVKVSGTNGRQLYLRTEPGLWARVRKLVSEGTVLLVLDGPTTADRLTWWQVRDPKSGVEGWAAARYLAPTSPP